MVKINRVLADDVFNGLPVLVFVQETQAVLVAPCVGLGQGGQDYLPLILTRSKGDRAFDFLPVRARFAGLRVDLVESFARSSAAKCRSDSVKAILRLLGVVAVVAGAPLVG